VVEVQVRPEQDINESAFTPMTNTPKRTYSAKYAKTATLFGNHSLLLIDLLQQRLFKQYYSNSKK